MFDNVVTSLIAGKFICQVSDPAAYDFLYDETIRDGHTRADDVDQYLRRIGMKLSVTKSGGAYYISHMNVDDNGKKAAKLLFTNLKNNIRLVVDFFKLVMDATGKDYSVNPGEKIELNRLMGSISQNPSLLEALRKVANLGKTVAHDGTDRQRLEKVIKRMQAEGYLEEVNREQDIYQFTGKIEYMHDAMEFLMLHDQITEEDEAFDSKVAAQ
jgi:hypothetical protein